MLQVPCRESATANAMVVGNRTEKAIASSPDIKRALATAKAAATASNELEVVSQSSMTASADICRKTRSWQLSFPKTARTPDEF